jgi:hypothetical protein
MSELSSPRHYCRHCHGKLKIPTANPREAFCVGGCHRSFYRHRCLVCERKMPRNAEHQKVCYRAECKTAWRLKLVNSCFLEWSSSSGHSTPNRTPLKNPIKSGLKTHAADGRGIEWAITVNGARIRAPRRVLDVVFDHIARRLTRSDEAR